MLDGSPIGSIEAVKGKWNEYSYPFNVKKDGVYTIKFQNITPYATCAFQNINISSADGFTTMSENKNSQYYISTPAQPFSMFDQPYSSFSITENFNTGNVFIPTNALKITYGSNILDPTYINAIQKHQLNPLNDLIKQNSQLTSNINRTHQNLNKKTDFVMRTQQQLLNDKNSDYNGDSPLFKDKKPTLADGLQDDINTMIIKENNLYILGTITLATLLLGVIVVARN